ncbi:MAG: hypothetical protein K6A74_01790 [Lachnospiraceae bacterium]|nr:hypothetical protein [Lachnospiraceae bacterium]
MIMMDTAPINMNVGQELVPSWMKLERLEYCQGFLDDIYPGKSHAIRHFINKLFRK